MTITADGQIQSRDDTVERDVKELLQFVLLELQKNNIHQSIISGEDVKDGDVE